MKNNILKSLTKNLGYKLLALAFAFALWLVVYNIDDPIKTVSYTLNVSIENENTLKDMGKYYEVIDGTNKVSFAVTAKRSVLDKLSESDFKAVADLDYLDINEEETEGKALINISCDRRVDGVKINFSQKYLKVSIEELMAKQFVVVADTVGEVAEGYALGDVYVSTPNVLKVSGPASLVDRVSYVAAHIDVADMAMNVTDNIVPILYDKDGNEVDTTRLALSTATVVVNAKILKTKEVPISVKASGNVADHYTVTEIRSNPEVVEVKGTTKDLNKIKAIEIPEELVDVSEANKDVKLSIDITEYLPEGVQLVDNTKSNVEITVKVDHVIEKDFNIWTKDIVVTGLATGTKLEYAYESVSVSISGVESDVNALVAKQINASIDLKDLKKGEHRVPLKIDVDDSKFSYEDTELLITIKDESDVNDNNLNESNEHGLNENRG